MRDEKDERRFEGLERELRSAVRGRRPEPPDSLLWFAEAVPVERRAGGLVAWLYRRPVVKIGLLASVAVVVAVATLAASQLLVGVRQSPPAASKAVSFDGWAWTQLPAHSRAHGVTLKTARGYVAVCNPGSPDAAACTSTDGVTWSLPPDPGVLNVRGSDPFLPWDIQRYKGVALAVSQKSKAEGQGSPWTLWRSTDEVAWTEVPWPDAAGMAFDLVHTTLARGFVARAAALGSGAGQQKDELFVSSDGLHWSLAGEFPAIGERMTISPTPDALFVSVTGGAELGTWRTVDAARWTKAKLPAGMDALTQVDRRPDGGYLGVAAGQASDGTQPTPTLVSSTVATSADGVTWKALSGKLTGSVDSVLEVGGRLIAETWADSSSPAPDVWQSFDSGVTWVRMTDLAGHPLSGGFLWDGSSLTTVQHGVTWLLSPVDRDPNATPPLSSMPAVSPT